MTAPPPPAKNSVDSVGAVSGSAAASQTAKVQATASASSEMTRNEKSLLLFFETAVVDYGGTLESARMNVDDFAIARRWNASGLVRFGRISFKDIKKYNGIARDHWCVLSEEAWGIAHAERRARAERVMAKLTVTRCGFDNLDDAPQAPIAAAV